jgi:hypothetical protein
MKDVYTIGPAVTVRVIPPPDTGRPENFIGSVGKSLQASGPSTPRSARSAIRSR